MIEGCKLKTGKDGRAEVESKMAARCAWRPIPKWISLVSPSPPMARSSQPRNSLPAPCTRISTLKKTGGKSENGDQFLLNFSQESIAVSEPAHFRVQLTANQATLAVFKGKVSATSPSGQVDVAEKHSATIDLADPAKKDAVVVAKNYEAEPTDAWDRQQVDYHDRYVSAGGSNLSSPYTYGVSDLNYYGSFMNCPGYGMGWQPFFTDASWSPFQDGGWMWYPESGYMFVSSYPWGWMPYRYGNWAFCRAAAAGCGAG